MNINEFFNAHFGEIFSAITTVTVPIILAMTGKWLHSHLNDARADRVQNAISSGIQAAIQSVTAGKTSKETISAVLNDATVRQNVVDLAKDYVQTTVPTAVAKLKIDPALADIISARVEEEVAKLAERYITANTAIQVAAKTEAVPAQNMSKLTV